MGIYREDFKHMQFISNYRHRENIFRPDPEGEMDRWPYGNPSYRHAMLSSSPYASYRDSALTERCYYRATGWSKGLFDEDGIVRAYRGDHDFPAVAAGVRYVSEGAFRGTGFRGDVYGPELGIFERDCFRDSSIGFVSSHAEGIRIEDYAFAGCKQLKRVKSCDLAYVGEGAFDGCEKLEQLDTDMLTIVKPFAFRGTALVSANFPVATEVSLEAFLDMPRLKTLSVAGKLIDLSIYSAGPAAIKKAQEELDAHLAGRLQVKGCTPEQEEAWLKSNEKLLSGSDFDDRYYVNQKLQQLGVAQTERICLEVLKKNPAAIRFMRVQTDAVCMAALQADFETLIYIRKPTPEMYMFVAQQRGNTVLKYVSEDLRTPELVHTAVENGPENIRYVKEQTLDLMMLAAKDWRGLKYIIEPPYEVCKAAVEHDAQLFRYVKNPTEELCWIALQQKAYTILYMENPTAEMWDHAIRMNSALATKSQSPTEEQMLLYIKEYPYSVKNMKNATEEMWEVAVSQQPELMEYSPFISDEMVSQAIHKKPYVIRAVKDITREKAMWAAEINPMCVVWMDRFYPEVFEYAVSQNIKVLSESKVKPYDLCRKLVEQDPENILRVIPPNCEKPEPYYKKMSHDGGMTYAQARELVHYAVARNWKLFRYLGCMQDTYTLKIAYQQDPDMVKYCEPRFPTFGSVDHCDENCLLDYLFLRTVPKAYGSLPESCKQLLAAPSPVVRQLINSVWESKTPVKVLNLYHQQATTGGSLSDEECATVNDIVLINTIILLAKGQKYAKELQYDTLVAELCFNGESAEAIYTRQQNRKRMDDIQKAAQNAGLGYLKLG